MPDGVSLLWRLLSIECQGVPVASLVVFAIGGLMYLSMSRAPPSATRSVAVRRPGWIARRRARSGISHPHSRVGGVGYRSAVAALHLDLAALNHHGDAGGAPA